MVPLSLRFGFVVVCLNCLIAAVVARPPGQEAVVPADRVVLERIALGKARTAGLRALSKLEIKPNLSVGAWVTSEKALDRAFRAWTRTQPWIGGPRIYSDGSCDVDVRVLPEDLAKQLVAMRQRPDAPAATESPTVAEIEAAARNWPILWATGTAETPEAGKGGLADGWEDISAEGVQLARLAAQADAAYAMIDEAARLKVTSARRVSEFLKSSAAVRDAVAEALQAGVQFKSELAPDQICVAQGAIGMPDLIRILTQVHQQAYKGSDFQAADFREMAMNNPSTEIRVTGLAPPPEKYRIRPEYELIELDLPEWTQKTLSATGRYDPQDGDDFPAAMRFELARWDGMDQLRRQVEGLTLQRDITVERYLSYRTSLKSDVALFLSGARIVNRPQTRADDSMEVRVELPLPRLWKILRRGASIVEVEPTEAASRPALKSSEVEER